MSVNLLPQHQTRPKEQAKVHLLPIPIEGLSHSPILMELVTFCPLPFPWACPHHLSPCRLGLPLWCCPPYEPPVVPGSIAPSPARVPEVVPAADYWLAMTPNVGTKRVSLIKSPQEVLLTQDISGGTSPLTLVKWVMFCF